MLDEKLINQHVLVFTLEGGPVFRLSGEDICCCFTLMAHTRVIASFLRVLQLQVNAARRDAAALMSNCATYQEASEILKQRPQLCANAKGMRALLPMLWGQVTRRRQLIKARLEKAKRRAQVYGALRAS